MWYGLENTSLKMCLKLKIACRIVLNVCFLARKKVFIKGVVIVEFSDQQF